MGNNAAYAQVIADQKSGSGENYHAFVHMAKLYKEKICQNQSLNGGIMSNVLEENLALQLWRVIEAAD